MTLLSVSFVARANVLDEVIKAAVKNGITLRLESLKDEGQAVVLSVVMDGTVLEPNQAVRDATIDEEEPLWVQSLRAQLTIWIG